MAPTIVVLEGDQTGQELLEEAIRVLDPAVTGVEVAFERFDLSLEERRKTKNDVVDDAANRMRETGLGLKAATITPEEAGDVGSPNAILRKAIDGTVILRTGRRIPAFVRSAVCMLRSRSCAWPSTTPTVLRNREGSGMDEYAYRTEKISRRVCRSVSEFAFQYAERTRAKVFGGPKYTVSPIYEGMLKEEMDAAAERHPTCATRRN